MSTNDTRVSDFIRWAMTQASGAADACCGQIGAAFRILQAERRKPGQSLDLDLAAAEHYMFARWLVCTGTVSKSQMKALTIGYDLKKTLDRAAGAPNKEATTGNPVSPPDWDVVLWSLSGAGEGVERTRGDIQTLPRLRRRDCVLKTSTDACSGTEQISLAEHCKKDIF